MRPPRQLKRRPAHEAIVAALPSIVAAAAGATPITIAEATDPMWRRGFGRHPHRTIVTAIRVSVALALVGRGVRVHEAIRYAEIGTAAYARGVPLGFASVTLAARRAAEKALPSEQSRADRLRRANEVIAEVAAARGLSASTLLERKTREAREARCEVVRRLRACMTNAEVAATLGLSRLTCYRLNKGGYHSEVDRRNPVNRREKASGGSGEASVMLQ